MTTTRRDDEGNGRRDDDAVVRDPRIEAAWRTASSEEPPAAIDAAIRAAARRAVGAGPQREDARTGFASRRWWPLAIAATLAAMTAGLLQLVPSDDVVGPSNKAVVTGIPATAKESPPEAPKAMPEAPKAMPEAPKRDSPPREAAKAEAAPRRDAAAAKPLAPAPRNENSPPRESARSPDPFPAAPVQAPAPAAPPAPPIAGKPAAPPPPPASTEARMAESGTAQMRAPSAAKERGALSVDDWIALIRRLRSEGKIDEAASELAAFRAAHSDHMRLLPADLRDWTPTTK
jgi:hypothetical protein